MNKKIIAENIDFADSEYKSFHMSEEAVLTVYLKSWDAKLLIITFTHVIQFSYQLGSDPSNLFEIEDSPVLKSILVEAYGGIPNNNPFKLFIIEDIDKFPFIQVVAESVTVIKDRS
ncbi:hypothetical protein [Candidatus Protochlamydia phocaeensis]|uniref:hypothetical protein n=1 Tax=Candidatus Protochlamydia phocaeensis TaxID=1414722 RepID=UPI000838228B|nr:hypothetical protein [Candidatus Protochlamydia phocaeensis]